MAYNPINVFEYESLAKSRLPKDQYDFIAGGATDEITLNRTRNMFDSIMLRPKVMTDVSSLNTETSVLGQTISFPVMLAPSGAQGRAHPMAEIATAKAAGALDTIMVLSAGSTYPMETISESNAGPMWFQQYFYKDKGITIEMAHRAKEAGFTALCLTMDIKARSKRERDLRNRYVTPPSVNHQWDINQDRDASASWKDLEWLSSRTTLPLVVKGIMTAEEARLCPDYGAQGIVVSNHGARQIDTTFSTIEVLPEVVDSVKDRIEVYLDGGIRRGSDIIKSLALGARAVLIGRPLFWGLAVSGEAGVTDILNILRSEMEVTMALCGRRTLDDLDRTMLGLKSPLNSYILDHQSTNLSGVS